MSVLEWIAKWGGIAGLIGMAWCAVEALRCRRKTQSLKREIYEKRPLMPPLDGMTADQQAADDLACAQEEADRLGLTPLHADYPTDTGIGVEPGAWRLKWPAAKRRIERAMAANA